MVKVKDLVEALQLETIVPARSNKLPIESSDINRPGLQFTGFWDYFAFERPQVLGKVEMTYLEMLDAKTRYERLSRFFSFDVPCVIICRNIRCFPEMEELAAARGIPVFRSTFVTTKVVLDMITFLNNYLAPRATRHGVLVDVYGVGIMITGESGVGKSEAALELVKRGHRLVADDVVDIRRVSDVRLVGESPEMVRHFMEIRGIGIIDISTMYGIGAVIRSKSIDMVVHLELWQEGKEYDRLGLNDEYTDILGVRVRKLVLPIRPGRNVAIVLEVAARNLRLKEQGYNAARELDKRLTERLARGAAGEDGDL
ncbi:MAG TPA: HPr kinase/phosphorylase [Candidatus Faecaligallichristensenella faecipullorum]|nr:HPr kinase/phosphorylase [Candidatus Faecaligallichristensenella faecipullorum]